MSTGQAIRIEIHKLKNLPPLPVQAQTILKCLSDPDISIETLAVALEQIPSLTARLLGVANSAYFGRSGKIFTIREAIIRVLGLTLVKSLSVGIILSNRFDLQQCPAFSPRQYWYCSMVTAILTQQFCHADRQRFPDPAIGYTAGLIVNLGLLALVHTFPDAMDEIFCESNDSNQKVSTILREWYDIDQYQMGGWLVKRWQLPEVYQYVTGKQKDPGYSGEYTLLAQLVERCSMVSRQLYHDQTSLNESLQRFTDIGFDTEVTKQIVERQQAKLESLNDMIGALSR